MSNIKNKLKQTNKEKNLVKKNLSIFQIILLIASIIAFSYLVGESLLVVSAATISCSISPSSGTLATTFEVICTGFQGDTTVRFEIYRNQGSQLIKEFTQNTVTIGNDIKAGVTFSGKELTQVGDYTVVVSSNGYTSSNVGFSIKNQGTSGTTDTACTSKGGTCMDVNSCTTGNIQAGLCSGPTSRRCCLPATGGQTTPTPNPSINSNYNLISSSVVPNIVSEGLKRTHNFLFNSGGGGSEAFTTTFAESHLGQEVTVEGITGILGKEGTKYFITDSAGVVHETSIVSEGVVTSTEAAGPGFFGTSLGGELTIGSLIANAGYAAAIYAGVNWGLQLFGVNPSLSSTIGKSAAVGYFAGFLASKYGLSSVVAKLIGISSGLATLGIGLLVGFVAFILFGGFTKHDERTVQFTCNLWDAPSGGKDCTKCNDGVFPCDEYRCKSLGQSCELVNKGTDQQLCVWVNRNDVSPPVIQPWSKVLTTGYQYIPNNAIAPPDRGVKIVPQGNVNGCIGAFTPLKLGITLDEPAKCKIGSVRKNNFNEMDTLFSGGRSLYNHSYQLSLPSPSALAAENITLPTGRDFSLYVRCQDKNGNSNIANFVFGFCVDEGPDTTPPIIVSTSIINGAPIAFNQTSIGLSVYVNEPAECRWSRTDLGYGDMENNMSCKTGVFQMNAQGLYECSTVLTGLKDRVDNNFYFRCKDQPHLARTANESKRNANEESYKFTLKGTEPLYISSAKPNGTTIKDSTNTIKVVLSVETSAGYNKGAALCSYEGYGTNKNFIQFYTTGTYNHSQDLYLPQGNYTYNIRCVDLGGNADTTQLNFNVETDTQPPIVVRVYHEGQSLKIITNENATCVYNDKPNIGNGGCEYAFEDGIKMGKSADGRIHFTNWDKNKIFYIKCQDDFGNRPLPKQCSITAKPFEI